MLLSLPVLFVDCGGSAPKPSSTIIVKPTIPKPTINVYVENSGSMFGYVKGVTEFEQSVYSYLSDIKISDCCNALNLYYINSKILKQPDDVEDFINKLEPDTFLAKGGELGITDLSDIMGNILKEQQTDTDVAVFISDCVFSPGGRYKKHDNADDYLLNQQIGIKGHFANKLKENPDFAVVVYRLMSQFDGIYYNKFDERTAIKAQRPFFIWLMGDCKQLIHLTETLDRNKIKGTGVQNVYMISRGCNKLSYGIMPQPRIGKFDIDRVDSHQSIVNVKPDTKGRSSRFMFTVGVDFSGLLLEDDYLLNSENYVVSNKAYVLEIVRNTNSLSSYTHLLKLTLNQPIVSRGPIKVRLLNRMTEWVYDKTDNSGLDIFADEAVEKTYGLKYLIEGVYDAYSVNDAYGEITINIK